MKKSSFNSTGRDFARFLPGSKGMETRRQLLYGMRSFKNQKGQALLYRSEDLINWTFINVLAESRGEWGTMWECPDFFRIGNRYVLTFSPIGAGERTCVYLTGSFDYDTGKFDYDVSGEIDWGFDYYAPQSFQAPDGRRIMVAWANEWEWMPFLKTGDRLTGKTGADSLIFRAKLI